MIIIVCRLISSPLPTVNGDTTDGCCICLHQSYSNMEITIIDPYLWRTRETGAYFSLIFPISFS